MIYDKFDDQILLLKHTTDLYIHRFLFQMYNFGVPKSLLLNLKLEKNYNPIRQTSNYIITIIIYKSFFCFKSKMFIIIVSLRNFYQKYTVIISYIFITLIAFYNVSISSPLHVFRTITLYGTQ